MKKIGIPSNNLLHPNSHFGTNYVDYIQKNYIDGITNAHALPIVLPIGDPKLAKNYMADCKIKPNTLHKKTAETLMVID